MEKKPEPLSVAAAKLFLSRPVPPSVADTAPVPHAQNACEGSDCVNYDFPFEVGPKKGNDDDSR